MIKESPDSGRDPDRRCADDRARAVRRRRSGPVRPSSRRAEPLGLVRRLSLPPPGRLAQQTGPGHAGRSGVAHVVQAGSEDVEWLYPDTTIERIPAQWLELRRSSSWSPTARPAPTSSTPVRHESAVPAGRSRWWTPWERARQPGDGAPRLDHAGCAYLSQPLRRPGSGLPDSRAAGQAGEIGDDPLAGLSSVSTTGA